MTDIVFLAISFGVGILLGAFYFGGLWWTVRKGLASSRPARWFFCSMLLRTSVVLIGFFFIGRGHWERLLTSLFGFVVCRVFVLRFTRLMETPAIHSSQETRHAS